MRRRSPIRKSTPKVFDGSVLKKNNHRLTPNYWNRVQSDVIIDVEKPGKGYKHFLKKKDVILFLELIPNWQEISKGLDAIVLANSGIDCDGYYNNDGVICISAWEKDKDIWVGQSYFKAHKALFERLGVRVSQEGDDYFCEFTEEQIKAYQLLHILLHELGHHVDRMSTKSEYTASRGEHFAEVFAFDFEAQIWVAYQNVFKVVF